MNPDSGLGYALLVNQPMDRDVPMFIYFTCFMEHVWDDPILVCFACLSGPRTTFWDDPIFT